MILPGLVKSAYEYKWVKSLFRPEGNLIQL